MTALMKIVRRLFQKPALWVGLVLLGLFSGCAGGVYYGPDGYGPYYDDYYGDDYEPGIYGGVWGPDIYAFGYHHHGNFDHNFAQRGVASRGAAGFHPGVGFHGGGGGHGGGGHR